LDRVRCARLFWICQPYNTNLKIKIFKFEMLSLTPQSTSTPSSEVSPTVTRSIILPSCTYASQLLKLSQDSHNQIITTCISCSIGSLVPDPLQEPPMFNSQLLITDSVWKSISQRDTFLALMSECKVVWSLAWKPHGESRLEWRRLSFPGGLIIVEIGRRVRSRRVI